MGLLSLLSQTLGRVARGVILSMDIYSMIKLEPCDTVTEVTKVRILSENYLLRIVNAVFEQILLSQDGVTKRDRSPDHISSANTFVMVVLFLSRRPPSTAHFSRVLVRCLPHERKIFPAEDFAGDHEPTHLHGSQRTRQPFPPRPYVESDWRSSRPAWIPVETTWSTRLPSACSPR